MAVITSLASYWALDEASGNALDSHGASTLTDNNTVGSGTGKVAGDRVFLVANSESLSCADNADVSTGDIDFTFCYWVKLDGTRVDMLIAKDGGGSADYYMLTSPTYFSFNVYSSASFGGSKTINATTFGSPSAGTWYFVVNWHDASANTLNIQVNDGTVDSTAHSAGVVDLGTTFRLGTDVFNTRFNGQLDEVGLWKKVLTSGERTWLYNSGNGRSYADIVAEAGGPPIGRVIRSRYLETY